MIGPAEFLQGQDPTPLLVLLALLAGSGLCRVLRRNAIVAQASGLVLACIIGLLLTELQQRRSHLGVGQIPVWDFPRLGVELSLSNASLPGLQLAILVLAGACLVMLLTGSSADSLPGLFLAFAGFAFVLTTSATPLAMPLLHPVLLLPITAWTPLMSSSSLPRLRRLSLVPMIALICFILANWVLVALIPIDPQNADLVQRAQFLLSAGLFVLCMPFPLHQLLRDPNEGTNPIPGAAVDLMLQFCILTVLHGTLLRHPILQSYEPLFAWLGWAGILTVVWGGLSALGTQDPRRIWFYASMLNWGMILLVVTLPVGRVWGTILGLFLVRIVCTMCCLAGLTQLDISRIRGNFQWAGLGHSLPWNMGLFLFGTLGLVGFPLTSGFGHFWITWQFIATIDWRVALVLALGTALAAVGLIRVLRILLRPEAETTHAQEPMALRLPAAGMLGLLVWISFVPQTLHPFVQALQQQFP
ncbi:MAG: hypothetical protein J4G06_02505 [Caldilineaceae bacterium]|nr:hypothetical protein [Caldilineaceae bacterium]